MANRFIMVTYTIEKEGRFYVSKCVELEVASYGSTVEEATENLNEATTLFIESLEELGICDETLHEMGVKTHHSEAPAVRPIVCPANVEIVSSAVLPLADRVAA